MGMARFRKRYRGRYFGANFFGIGGPDEDSIAGRVVYVDVARAFNGHGLCDTGLPWVISGLRPAAAGPPNLLGQAAYAAVLYGAGVR